MNIDNFTITTINKNLVMKKILISAFLLVTVAFVSAQRINKISVSNKGSNTTVSVLLSENVMVNVNQDGNIVEWGVDKYADRGATNNVYRKLTPYEGRVEYYTDKDNEAFRGKIKSIGSTIITYFASFEEASMVGRIKSIGAQKFGYYTKYDDATSAGKLKSIGSSNFVYYSSFENDAIKGKIKNAANVVFTYFSSMDDKSIAGNFKSVNGSAFEYYTTQDPYHSKGSLKSGNQLQVIGGITYLIAN